MLKVGLIVGSTRPNRFADTPVQWLVERASARHEVNIAMEPYLGVVQNGRSLNDYGYLVQSREAMFDHLVWWGEALKAARQNAAAASFTPAPIHPARLTPTNRQAKTAATRSRL